MSIEPRASDFADWVFIRSKGRWQRRSADAAAEEQVALTLGALDHAEIHRMRREYGGEASEWDVRYADIDDPEKKTFLSSCLTVNGSPLRCRPDLVLEHRRSRRIVIVERKTTRQWRVIDRDEPGNWKNIQAQLWCYSYIDEWATEERITLVAELWRLHEGLLTKAIEPLTWEKGDPEHEKQCGDLFREWCRSAGHSG